jgi:hypothetical protein
MAWALLPRSPCFARVLSNVVRKFQACGMLCGIVLLGFHSLSVLQVAFEGGGWGNTRSKGGKEKILGATACSLSALGKMIFCPPSSRADASKSM